MCVLNEHDLVIAKSNEFNDRVKLQNAKNNRIQDRKQLYPYDIREVADCGSH